MELPRRRSCRSAMIVSFLARLIAWHTCTPCQLYYTRNCTTPAIDCAQLAVFLKVRCQIERSYAHQAVLHNGWIEGLCGKRALADCGPQAPPAIVALHSATQRARSG